MTASAFRLLLIPEIVIGILGILWAIVSPRDELSYEPTPTLVLAAMGLTVVFAALNFGLFFLGRRYGSARAVYAFLEEDIFPLVRHASLGELLLGAAMAGFSEELLFRGLLQPRLGIIATSLLFGLLHGPGRALWPLALWAGGAGFLLGLLYESTGSLLLPTLVHALYDAAALLYVRYYWRPREARESV